MSNENNRRYYRGKAREWALSETAKGDPMISILFGISTPDATHSVLTYRGTFATEKSADITIEALRTCGFEGDDLTHLEGLDRNEVELVVEDEEYEGKPQPRIRFINRPRALNVKQPMAEDKKRTFAAEMKARFRAFDAGNGKRAASNPKPTPAGPRTPEPPPLDDADFPF